MKKDSGVMCINAILILFISILCSGCGSLCNHRAVLSDSVRVEIVERRVLISDTVRVEIPLIEERVTVMQDSSLLENRYAVSEAIICSDGTLFHSLETIAQDIYTPIKHEVEVRDSIVFRERVVTKLVERELTSWQKFQISGFYLLFVLLVILMLIKVSI